METLTTSDVIMREIRLKEVALRDGKGRVERIEGGAFVVYSRVSRRELLDIIQRSNPSVQDLDQMKTIFLMGPTPKFWGEDGRATTSWRREFLSYVSTSKSLNENWMIILPEPFDCNWSSVDYPLLSSGEQVSAQIHWEDYFIGLSMRNGIAVFHSHFRWKGNAGPTARFEGGRLLASLAHLDRVVFNLSPDSQSVPYIEPHLSKALCLNELGSFRLTRCSPLHRPSSSDEGVMEEEEAEEREVVGQMNVFFDAILSLVERQ